MLIVKIGNIGTRAKNLSDEYLYTRKQIRDTSVGIMNLEAAKGSLNRNIIRQVDDYAITVLKNEKYKWWLRLYATFQGRFVEGWIPDNFYAKNVVPKIKGSYGTVASMRPLARSIFRSDLFPDIAYCVNGIFFDKERNVVPDALIPDHLFRSSERVVFKLDSSAQGKGVRFFDRNTFDARDISSLGSGVFQDFIVQHESLHHISPWSVATIRLTTVVEDSGAISLRGAYLRLGRSGETHVASRSAIRVAVDLQSGSLSSEGFLPDWRLVSRHPDSGVPFEGESVPKFSQCAAVVRKLHQEFPFARSIGWDIAVTREGRSLVMEWNSRHNDIKFSEASQGPCFADLGWHKYA